MQCFVLTGSAEQIRIDGDTTFDFWGLRWSWELIASRKLHQNLYFLERSQGDQDPFMFKHSWDHFKSHPMNIKCCIGTRQLKLKNKQTWVVYFRSNRHIDHPIFHVGGRIVLSTSKGNANYSFIVLSLLHLVLLHCFCCLTVAEHCGAGMLYSLAVLLFFTIISVIINIVLSSKYYELGAL